MPTPAVEVDAGGRPVRISNPDRVIYEATEATPEVTKLMVAEYFVSVEDGLMRALRPEIYGFDSQHFAAMRKREANSALLRAFVPELKRQARTAAVAREVAGEAVTAQA